MFIDSPSQKCIHWCISNEQISYYNTKYIGFASNRDGGFADYSPFADFLGAANAELWMGTSITHDCMQFRPK